MSVLEESEPPKTSHKPNSTRSEHPQDNLPIPTPTKRRTHDFAHLPTRCLHRCNKQPRHITLPLHTTHNHSSQIPTTAIHNPPTLLARSHYCNTQTATQSIQAPHLQAPKMYSPPSDHPNPHTPPHSAISHTSQNLSKTQPTKTLPTHIIPHSTPILPSTPHNGH